MNHPAPHRPPGAGDRRRTLRLLALGLTLVVLGPARIAAGQASALIAPGPLSKAHARLEGLGNCEKCHEPGRKVTASRCLACHQPIAARIAARRGVHRNVTTDCVRCHSEHNGVDAELRPFDTRQFNHAAETGFALDGRHAAVAANCAKCHTGRSFLQAKAACAACHADPHKGALGANCATCHTVQQAFADARTGFDHSRAKFQLVGAHRRVECARCHVNKVFTGLQFASCTDCHKTPHKQALAQSCTACHGNDTWKTQKMDHARTAFPLRGRHEAVACGGCHRGSPVQVRLEFNRCAACHADVHRGQFKEDCAACHKETGFRTVPFDHAVRTKFALTGRHAALPCWRCHPNAAATPATASLVPATVQPVRRARGGSQAPATPAVSQVLFSGASTACVSCHPDPHRGETASDCSSCHTTDDFKVSAYKHAAGLDPFFAGRHASATCADCHGRLTPRPFVRGDSGSPAAPAVVAAAQPATPAAAARPAPVANWRFKNLGTACATCHADPHDGQFKWTCDACHAVEDTGFKASRFSHDKTGFPLTGKHATVPCANCHKRPATPRAPDRIGVNRSFGQGVRIQLVSLVSFRQQASAPAGQAPAKPRPVMGKDCLSCHTDPHLGQLGTACDRCHGNDTFKIANFKHTDAKLTPFFKGTHATLACHACHKPEQAAYPAGTGVAIRYLGSGTRCSACHVNDDPHRGALGKDCESCHIASAWKSASRAFHKAGLFPLEGRHLAVPCASCHVNGVMKGTPTNCYDCHWVRRQDDRYQTRLGMQCEQCHRPTGWLPVQWNHAASTGFQLSLAHQVLRCDNCHRDGQFVGASSNCISCHQADFSRATSPNHVAAGFPTTCELCHTAAQTSWHQATFNHASFFPLVGVHAQQACVTCHRNNVFAGTASDCLSCHRADYQRTVNPNHAAAGFPTTCDTCHRASDASWTVASFNHASFFPLVGVHATQACSACHKNNTFAGTPTNCFGCHQADYQRTSNPNHAAAGFPTTCDSCHSAAASSWTASFNHNSVFPLVGVHATQPCSACHKNNTFAGTPTDCVGCHLADYQRTTNPNHAAAGFPTTCTACHRATDSSWQQGTFNHTWFPITSGRHAGLACSSCHTASNNFAVFTCTNCHTRSQTDSNHTGVSGYRYDSAACYACHPTGSGGRP